MFLVSVLIFYGVLADGLASEPCYNKFPYEYNVLQELANHARQLKDLQEKCDAFPGGNISTPLRQQCPDGWVSYDGSCYLFAYDNARSFADAVQFCAQFDAVLVHVNNERENTFLRDMLRRYKPHSWWLGLTDQVTEGDWRWIDTGKTPEYTGFYPGEPESRSDEDCGGFHHPYSFDFKWVDVTCSAAWLPICEKW